MAEKNEITLISDDIEFQGSLQADHPVVIAGKFSGNLKTRGKLHIEPGAVVKASVVARECDIEGNLQGNVIGTELVSLKSTAQVVGDIDCQSLEVLKGAKHIGSTLMK